MIFDFSGTLLRCESAATWLSGTLAAAGIDATEAELEHYAARLHASGGQPGGQAGDVAVPPHLAKLWERRDLDLADHRTVYTELMRRAELPWPGIEHLLYERQWFPQMWRPYPDAKAALTLLKEKAIPVAVLSNVPCDIRPIFRHHELDDLIDGYIFSYEHGMQKPDPEIFRRACDLLGHAPGDVRMVGDNVTADGGAAGIGCEFRPVEHLPVSERPHALLDAVA